MWSYLKASTVSIHCLILRLCVGLKMPMRSLNESLERFLWSTLKFQTGRDGVGHVGEVYGLRAINLARCQPETRLRRHSTQPTATYHSGSDNNPFLHYGWPDLCHRWGRLPYQAFESSVSFWKLYMVANSLHGKMKTNRLSIKNLKTASFAIRLVYEFCMLNEHVLLGSSYRSNGPKGIQKTGRLNSTFWFVILAIIFLYPLILQYRKYTRIDANVANHLVNSKGFNWKLTLCLLYQIFHYKAGKTIELISAETTSKF